MQPVGPLADPLAGRLNRVVCEDRFAGVVPLHEPHAAAAEQVDGGVDDHGWATSKVVASAAKVRVKVWPAVTVTFAFRTPGGA